MGLFLFKQKGKQMTHIYVIAETGTALVKIGMTDDPKARLNQLQTANPRKLYHRLLWSFGDRKTASDVEAFLHEVFATTRREGEWFEICDGDVFWRLLSIVDLCFTNFHELGETYNPEKEKMIIKALGCRKDGHRRAA